MSHVPLLSKQSAPKLQSPRRGPQVLLVCTGMALLLLLLPQSTYEALSWNATRAHDDLPPAARRVMRAATQHQFVEDDLFQDLLATVSYLARRESGQR
jgi:hypothetical protein